MNEVKNFPGLFEQIDSQKK
jgi:ATP-binding cassette, subfamily A (ABC1), member 3